MKKIFIIILLSSLCFGGAFYSYPLNRFYVNLLSENGTEYLETDIVLYIQKISDSMLADQQKAKIRDIILTLLSSNTMMELSTIKGKSRLKAKIMKTINTKIRKDFISGIYFTHFVIDPRRNKKEDQLDDLYEKLDNINNNLTDINNNIKTLIGIMANKP